MKANPSSWEVINKGNISIKARNEQCLDNMTIKTDFAQFCTRVTRHLHSCIQINMYKKLSPVSNF